MQAGIGGILTALEHRHAQYVIGAIVFTSRALAPEGRDKTWMRWGTMLALHGDLPDDTWCQWMTGDASEGIPAWVSFNAMRQETRRRLVREAQRRIDDRRSAALVLEQRNMVRQAGKISNGYRGRQIMRRAREDFLDAQEEAWIGIDPETLAGAELLANCTNGVLTEFRADDRCQQCAATGIMPYVVDERRCEVVCPSCHGTGVEQTSERERAALIRVTRSAYRSCAKKPYEWLYNEAMAARREAVRHLRDQLSD